MIDRNAVLWPCAPAFPLVGGLAPTPAVRNLALRRRRSRMPWMYALYHAPPPEPRGGDPGQPVLRPAAGQAQDVA
jgi:hypothetical protein